MKKEEKQLTEQESLQIIHNMIASAKTGIKDNGFFYLLWGWLVFIASSANYVLQFMLNSHYPWLPWAVLMPLGGLVTGIVGRREEKQKKVKTYFDDFLGYLLIAFLVCLFITLFFQSKLQLNCYPMLMMLYGIWLFVTGGALHFKALIIGGVINWAFAIASLFVTFEYQLVFLSLAVLLGYIIPGHMLNYQYKKDV